MLVLKLRETNYVHSHIKKSSQFQTLNKNTQMSLLSLQAIPPQVCAYGFSPHGVKEYLTLT